MKTNDNIYDEIGVPSIQHYHTLCKLTEPLKIYFGIDRFWRNEHRLDGFYSVIGNYPPTAEVFFGENFYKGHPFFRNPLFFQSGFLLPGLLQREDYNNTQGKLMGKGDCHHVFIKIFKHERGFIEYGFATSKPYSGFEMTYLNNLSAIDQFIAYFDVNAKKIIQNSQDCAIDISQIIGDPYQLNPNLPNGVTIPQKTLEFLTKVNKYPEQVQALATLTLSERICFKYYLQGNTAKEIGKIIHRSQRTVESHLEIIKSKLNISKRSKLTELFTPFLDVL